MERFDVLDKGWIELQGILGNDLEIVNAARTSYLGESKGEEADKKLLFYLIKNRHFTPVEMATIKIRVNMPEVVARQWVRHRSMSFNAQSFRYTEAQEDQFYIPSVWRLQDTKNKQGSNGVLDNEASGVLTGLLETHVAESMNNYKIALEHGVAREEARLFLPGFSLYSQWVICCDLRNWLHFCGLRMDEHAQYEIRQFANCLYENIIKPNFKWTCEAWELYDKTI